VSGLNQTNEPNEPTMHLPSDTEVVILDLLRPGIEMYGLEMVKTSKRLKRGTVYVTLNRMIEKGYVKCRPLEDPSISGKPRQLYSITGLGQKVLAAKCAAESVLHGTAVVGGQPA
jgi:PadR family transcriptional regulator